MRCVCVWMCARRVWHRHRLLLGSCSACAHVKSRRSSSVGQSVASRRLRAIEKLFPTRQSASSESSLSSSSRTFTLLRSSVIIGEVVRVTTARVARASAPSARTERDQQVKHIFSHIYQIICHTWVQNFIKIINFVWNFKEFQNCWVCIKKLLKCRLF